MYVETAFVDALGGSGAGAGFDVVLMPTESEEQSFWGGACGENEGFALWVIMCVCV